MELTKFRAPGYTCNWMARYICRPLLSAPGSDSDKHVGIRNRGISVAYPFLHSSKSSTSDFPRVEKGLVHLTVSVLGNGVQRHRERLPDLRQYGCIQSFRFFC